MIRRRTLSRRTRGQILPVAAVLATLAVTAVAFIYNAVVVTGNARTIMEGSARAAGYAAIFRSDPVAAYGRWDIDEAAATTRAREIIERTLAGDGTVSPANAAGLFRGNLATLLVRDTAGGTRDGLDVEVIVPAIDASYASTRHVNGTAATVQVADPTRYPHAVTSAITGSTYDRSTVVVRLRLTVIQFGAPDRAVEVVVASSVGTDG